MFQKNELRTKTADYHIHKPLIIKQENPLVS